MRYSEVTICFLNILMGTNTKLNKQRVIYCGGHGFPFGSATVQRQIQMSKTLQLSDFEVIVLMNRGTYAKEIVRREGIRAFGSYERIKYYHTSFCSFKPKGFISRNFLKIFGRFSEVFFIGYFSLFKNTDVLLYRAHNLSSAKFYSKMGRFFKMKRIYDYVEFYDSLRKRDQRSVEVEQRDSFDQNIHKYADKFIVISKYLENHIKNYDKPFIRIPPIIDFGQFKNTCPFKADKPYFLYCGSIVYLDIIRFITRSFMNSGVKDLGFGLKLVISGSKDEIDGLIESIESEKCSDSIEVLNKLEYSRLISYYAGAYALLIPLSESLQDQARFPFKICEYVASKRPILTSSVGVINDYFSDGVNAFVVPPDDAELFSDKLKLVAESNLIADKVGMTGYELGYHHFHFEKYGGEMKSFFQ